MKRLMRGLGLVATLLGGCDLIPENPVPGFPAPGGEQGGGGFAALPDLAMGTTCGEWYAGNKYCLSGGLRLVTPDEIATCLALHARQAATLYPADRAKAAAVLDCAVRQHCGVLEGVSGGGVTAFDSPKCVDRWCATEVAACAP